MSDQDNRNNGYLVPVGRRDLTSVAAANPLVPRGLADLAQGRLLKVSEAIPLDPKNALFYYNRGRAWQIKKDYDNAIKDFDEAIRIDPNYERAYFFRGDAWLRMGELDKAINDYDEAIRIDPNAFMYFYCSRLWLAKGDYGQAIKYLNEAIRLDPTETYYHLRGKAWYLKKDYDKAMKDFDEAIRLDPIDVNAHSLLAWLLATCPKGNFRDGKRAILLATKACELTAWKSGLELGTLAAAYAEAGQFDEAERYQAKALEDPASRGLEGDAFRQRLELYKERKAYRQGT